MAFSLSRNVAAAVSLSCRQSLSFSRTFTTSSCLRARLQPPQSPTFYTGRSAFYDYIATLERAIVHTRNTLKTLQLDNLPEFAKNSLPPPVSAWKSKEELASTLTAKLSASRHRRLVQLLNQLNDYRRVASTSGHYELAHGLDSVLEMFERPDKEQHLRRGQRKAATIDEYGRAYAYGARKTSSARVWVISTEHITTARMREGKPAPPVTEILVNNTPLNEYFRIPVDRERILRPFRLAGLLGAFNVFAIVRGGGTTGQAGAVAHGVAKCLAALVPDVELILRRGTVIGFNQTATCADTLIAKLVRRDPRMVERKKTGRAKARKGVCLLYSRRAIKRLTPFAVYLGQTVVVRTRNLLQPVYTSTIMQLYYALEYTPNQSYQRKRKMTRLATIKIMKTSLYKPCEDKNQRIYNRKKSLEIKMLHFR